MYTIDDRDAVVELTEVPQSSVGAPCPMLLAGDGDLRLAYFLEETDAGWDGSFVRLVDQHTNGEPCALVRFSRASAHMFGPPNDEAFQGHPLAKRGLGPYGVFEVQHSSWVRQLERMNSVHPHHDPKHFAGYKHFVFAFHDDTFECVAVDFQVSVHRGSVWSVLRSSSPRA